MIIGGKSTKGHRHSNLGSTKVNCQIRSPYGLRHVPVVGLSPTPISFFLKELQSCTSESRDTIGSGLCLPGH